MLLASLTRLVHVGPLLLALLPASLLGDASMSLAWLHSRASSLLLGPWALLRSAGSRVRRLRFFLDSLKCMH